MMTKETLMLDIGDLIYLGIDSMGMGRFGRGKMC